MDLCNLLTWYGVVEVMKQLHDFQTLQMLLRASPDAAAVFASHASEIIEAVALSSLEPQLLQLLEITIKLHTGTLLENDKVAQAFAKDCLTKLIYHVDWDMDEDYGDEEIYDIEDSDNEVRDYDLQEALELVQPIFTRKLVTIAANINRLTPLILAEFVRRLAMSRPSHPVDARFGFDFSQVSDDERATGAWPPPSAKFRAFTFSTEWLQDRPVSWVEAYRVRRALWSLQILTDVQERSPSIIWGLTTNSLANHVRWGPLGTDSIVLPYFLFTPHPFMRHNTEISDVCRCAQDLGPKIDKTWPADHPSRNEKPSRDPIPSTFENAVLLHNYLARLPRCNQLPTQSSEATISAQRPRRDFYGERWGMDKAAVLKTSPGAVVHSCILALTRAPWSSGYQRPAIIKLRDYMALFHFGFSIWDTERLNGLELINPTLQARICEPYYSPDTAFTWISLIRSAFDHI
jgi:hypothetical protein